MPIVIATRPVDFRRGHDGLAATVQNELGLDPYCGLTVCGRRIAEIVRALEVRR
ncbi:IS66 family insertion sequence element accessory protein TnpB [Aurantimonas sp. A2-1-M11]|uniref:IS66 family insertion sequence element accessory protein TnpB n=1 Tax=Aurantimonas sp. A2-1-M11 TaxID=3113712 RepID=UPI002F936202